VIPAIDDFVNRVRHHVRVEDHQFEAIDKKVLEHLFDV